MEMKKSLLAIISLALALAVASPADAGNASGKLKAKSQAAKEQKSDKPKAEKPQATEEQKAAQIEALTAHGIEASKAGDNKTAIDDFTKAIAIDPKFTPTYAMRGYAYILTGNFKAAIEDYSKAIDLSPQYAWAYNGRGAAHGALGEYEAALSDYTKAVDLDPAFALAVENKERTAKLLATPPGAPNKSLVWSLLSNKSEFEDFAQKDCQSFTAPFVAVAGNNGLALKAAQETYNSQRPNSRMNMRNCSGEYVEGARTFTFGEGGRLLKYTETSNGLELTFTYPAGGVNISVVSQTQTSVMAQIACANDSCNLVDVSLPGMDARGSMLVIVDGKGVSIGSNALIAFLNGYYERKHSRYDDMIAFCNDLIGKDAFRRKVMEAFVP